MLKVTVLEPSTEMLDQTYAGKQMAQVCLSCTVHSHSASGALNMYQAIGLLNSKPWSFSSYYDSLGIILVLSSM